MCACVSVYANVCVCMCVRVGDRPSAEFLRQRSRATAAPPATRKMSIIREQVVFSEAWESDETPSDAFTATGAAAFTSIFNTILDRIVAAR